jgi:hypothetical protein
MVGSWLLFSQLASELAWEKYVQCIQCQVVCTIWAGMLAKRKNAAFASYITGCIYFTAYIGFASSYSFGLA